MRRRRCGGCYVLFCCRRFLIWGAGEGDYIGLRFTPLALDLLDFDDSTASSMVHISNRHLLVQL